MRTARLIYNGIGLVFLTLAWPYVFWAGMRRRKEWKERLGFVDARLEGSIWVHAASVGEVRAAAPLLEAISKVTDRPIVITTVTVTGNKLAESLKPSGGKAFAPFDLSLLVRRCIRGLRPRALILLESEVWPNLIEECSASGAKVALVNARLSESSVVWYRRGAFLFGKTLKAVSLFAAQSEPDARRISKLVGEESLVEITGNLKHDNLRNRPNEKEKSSFRDELGIGSEVLVAGSVRGDEIPAILDAAALLKSKRGTQTIVAPRHMKPVRMIMRECEQRGLSAVTRSTGGNRGFDVLVLDTTGELDKVYGIADVAFVGGSMVPVGGKKQMEQEADEEPVDFGTHMENCLEMADQLLESGAAEQLSPELAVGEVLEKLFMDSVKRREMSVKAEAVAAKLKGASKRTVDLLVREGFFG
jgi:3-deoxy-D-manno-octulosonic-acid transferase